MGKYFLIERVAAGGMAEVYRAKSLGAKGFEKEVAVKLILESYAKNEEFREMFEHEARLSSMLQHNNIVQIFDFTEFGDTYLLAMEFVHGKNLREFLNKARKANYEVPIEFAVFVANEVCKGLDYAHNKKDDKTGASLNIIHRDMSPQNVMVSYEGDIKIVDFGIAKAKDQFDETRTGVIKGKFGYMSPEQAQGHKVDARTDIFASAVMLYELLTGERLFAAENEIAILKKIQDCVVPKLSEKNAKVPSELETILLKALAKNPDERYQTAGEFHIALQTFLNKFAPAYTQKALGDVYHDVFEHEITAELKKVQQDIDVSKLIEEESVIAGGTQVSREFEIPIDEQMVMEEEPSAPKSKVKAILSFAFLLGLAGGTVYLYVLYSQDRLSAFWSSERTREVAAKKTVSRPDLDEQAEAELEKMDALEDITEKIAGSVCTLRVNSYPREATIFLNKKEVGVTPDVLTIPCNRAFDVSLKLKGYEVLNKSITTRKKENRVFYTLKKSPKK